jgi:protein SCO1/2
MCGIYKRSLQEAHLGDKINDISIFVKCRLCRKGERAMPKEDSSQTHLVTDKVHVTRRAATVVVSAVCVAAATYRLLRVRRPDPKSIVAPFQLEASSGGAITSESLKGHPYLIFFGFTRCPNICPSTLVDITSMIETLRKEGRFLQAFFISVDPERDSAAVLKEYLSSFGDVVVGLSGSLPQVEAVVKEFKVFVQRVPLADGDYTMDHSALIYVVDGAGRRVGALSPGQSAEASLATVRDILGQA